MRRIRLPGGQQAAHHAQRPIRKVIQHQPPRFPRRRFALVIRPHLRVMRPQAHGTSTFHVLIL